MVIFKILDGRKSFYQWDLHQKLVVMDDAVTEVHFPMGTDRCPPVPVYEYESKRVVDVPNVLLQTAGVMHLYAFVKGNDGERTICSHTFRVNEKRKPDDYVYTEQECWTTEEAVRKALLEAKESGEFKGEPGPAGEVGPAGPQGPAGYTPQKGVDYFTEADKIDVLTNTDLTTEEKTQARDKIGAASAEELGNIEAALDSIIAIQNELIGGVA